MMSFKYQSKLIIVCLSLLGCGIARNSISIKPAKDVPSAVMSSIIVTSNNIADGTTPAQVTLFIRTSSGKPAVGIPLILSVSGSENVVLPCGLTDRRGIAQCRFFSKKAESKMVVVKGGINLSAPTNFVNPNWLKNVSARRNAVFREVLPGSGSRLSDSRTLSEKFCTDLADTPFDQKEKKSTLAVPSSGTGVAGRVVMWW